MPNFHPQEHIICVEGHFLAQVTASPEGADPVLRWKTPRIMLPTRCECGAPFYRERPAPAWHVHQRGWVEV
jgi:hypothetical protein